MNKSELNKLFDGFAKSVVKIGPDGCYIYGHYVNVQKVERSKYWDVWICNQKEYIKNNMTAYLGTGKLNNFQKLIPKNIKVHRYNGELWFQTTDFMRLKAWLEEHRKALGIKKRVIKTPEQIAKLTETLRLSREAKNNTSTEHS